jgi:hypothetical protein
MKRYKFIYYFPVLFPGARFLKRNTLSGKPKKALFFEKYRERTLKVNSKGSDTRNPELQT